MRVEASIPPLQAHLDELTHALAILLAQTPAQFMTATWVTRRQCRSRPRCHPRFLRRSSLSAPTATTTDILENCIVENNATTVTTGAVVIGGTGGNTVDTVVAYSNYTACIAGIDTISKRTSGATGWVTG